MFSLKDYKIIKIKKNKDTYIKKLEFLRIFSFFYSIPGNKLVCLHLV